MPSVNPGPATNIVANGTAVVVYNGYSTDTLPTVGVPTNAQYYCQDTGISLFWNAYGKTWSSSVGNGLDIRAYGAVVNGISLYDATMTQLTTTTATMSAPDANFTQADVGKIASYLQTGSGAQPIRYGKIFSVQSATSCTVTVQSATTASMIMVYGTDDSAAVQAAFAASAAMLNPAPVFFPSGICTVSQALTCPDRTDLFGLGNTPTVDYSYNFKYSGSSLVLAGANLGGGASFVTLGTIGGAASYAPSVRFMNIDAMAGAGTCVYAYNRACHIFACNIMRGTTNYALNGGLSMVVEFCTLFNNETGPVASLVSDTRFTNNYIFGAGTNFQTVQIAGDDIMFTNNHMWRDADVDVPGPLVSIYVNGTNYGGAITIANNAFDTDVQANVVVNIIGSGSLRTLNIYGNHSLENSLISTNASATFNATFNGTTTMTVNSLTTGFIYQGTVLGGTGVGTNNYIVNQLTGTLGGAGTYTISAMVASATEAVSSYGYPYIQLLIGAGSNLRLLSAQANQAHGSFSGINTGPMASFLDVSQIAGNLYGSIIQGNICDDTAIGYATTVGGSFTPTIGANLNLLIRNSASTTPVTF